MGVINTVALLFGKQDGTIADIVMDAVVQESYDLQSDVTDHPVEPGFSITDLANKKQVNSISDNVRKKPDTITINAIISNTPVSPLGIQLIKGLGNVSNSLSQKNSFLDAFKTVQAGPSKEAFDKLNDIMDQGQIVKVVTSLKTYDSMVIQSLSINRTATTSQALVFTAVCKQIRLVQSLTVPAPEIPKSTSGQKKQSKGSQPTKESQTPQADKSKSLIKSLKDSLTRRP